MTTITAPRASHVTATLWERALVVGAQRLERAALRHMRRRAASARRDETIRTVTETQRDAHAAGALRMFDR